jgi:polo-like kinase 1
MISALKYLHAHKVIHRDLKLGNLFVNDKMEIKIGDFGLATKLEFEGDRKRTIWGTPNYIAPEILEGKNGHSYEVDIWSLGVIIYTLLIGKPPFETSDVKTTYKKIRMNAYNFPDNIKWSKQSKDLIASILHLDPAKRPNLTQILEHEFFHMGVAIPKALPTYTLAWPPAESYTSKFMKGVSSKDVKRGTSARRITDKHGLSEAGSGGFKTARGKENDPKKLKRDKSKASLTARMLAIQGDLDPELIEIVKLDTHVVDYVDYSSKYGIGYLLSNHTYGVFYNDSTKVIFDPYQETIEYINKKSSTDLDRVKKFHISDQQPDSDIKKKLTLLQHFRSYLDKAEKAANRKNDAMQPYSGDDTQDKSVVVKKWMRTKHAIIFRLSNKIVQVIFFDHTQIILHPENRAVTYINKKAERVYYSIESSVEEINPEMAKRMNYTRQVLTHMIENKFK